MAGPLSRRKSADGLEVWREPPGQPQNLKVALRLTLQPAAGWHPIQVAVEVQLEKDRWMVAGPATLGGHGPGKPELRQI